MVIEGRNFFDSLYMVVITLATVGLGETHPLTFHGRIVTIVFIVGWTGIVFYALGTIIQPIIEGEIRKVLRRKRILFG